MSTTNEWDIVGGFNQDYLNELALDLYTKGTLPSTFQQAGIDLTLERPSLTFSAKDPNALVLVYGFTGTMAGSAVEGTVTIETDISKLAAAYVDQSAYIQIDGTSAEYASCGTLSSLNTGTDGCTFEAWINLQ